MTFGKQENLHDITFYINNHLLIPAEEIRGNPERFHFRFHLRNYFIKPFSGFLSELTAIIACL